MKLRTAVINVVIFLVVATAAGYLVLDHSTLEQRAFAAYQAHDYARALPLFKEYVKTPGVYSNNDQRMKITTIINELQIKLQPPATGPDQKTLIDQAMSYALQNSATPGSPPTGDDRVPHQPMKPGEIRTMAIKELGNFEFDPNVDSRVPADVEALSGAHVRLNGFMIPLTQAEKIDRFALVPTLGSCCYGAPPGIQHIITCSLPADKAVNFCIDEIVVEGVLGVSVKRDQGFTSEIFTLHVTSVKLKE